MKIVSYGIGTYKKFDNLKDLEDQAELIIIGTANNELHTPNDFSNPNGEAWFDSSIKVEKVLKGQYKGKEITVAEPLFVEDNVIFSIVGYSPILPNRTYILFLVKSQFGTGSHKEYAWNTLSLNFGKYNLDKQDKIEEKMSDDKQIRLKEKVIRKYINKK